MSDSYDTPHSQHAGRFIQLTLNHDEAFFLSWAMNSAFAQVDGELAYQLEAASWIRRAYDNLGLEKAKALSARFRQLVEAGFPGAEIVGNETPPMIHFLGLGLQPSECDHCICYSTPGDGVCCDCKERNPAITPSKPGT